MRTTFVLLQQHAGWMFRRHWKVQGKRVLRDSGALKALKERGIAVESAIDFVNDILPSPTVSANPKPYLNISKAVEFVEYLSFNDSNVLIAGLDQAKMFTNSIEICPDTLLKKMDSSNFSRHDLVKRCIQSSLLYDAYQEKLPKRTDPERPAWNFPRDYGLTDRRKNLLLCNRLVQLCSSLNPQLLAHRRTMSDVSFNVPLIRDDKDVLLSLRADILQFSSDAVEPPSSLIDVKSNSLDKHVPNISPLLPTISLIKEVGPVASILGSSEISAAVDKWNIHTAIVHFNSTETTNIHDSEVTRDQFLSRSLMKAYTFALAEARRLYGKNVEDLPQPITVQCVHTDSKDFHFSVLQLNTVKDSTSTDVTNFYWSLPVQSLYQTCEYVSGKPILEGYNPFVFNTLLKFWCNS